MKSENSQLFHYQLIRKYFLKRKVVILKLRKSVCLFSVEFRINVIGRTHFNSHITKTDVRDKFIPRPWSWA